MSLSFFMVLSLVNYGKVPGIYPTSRNRLREALPIQMPPYGNGKARLYAAAHSGIRDVEERGERCPARYVR
jgi:hypothetical protein